MTLDFGDWPAGGRVLSGKTAFTFLQEIPQLVELILLVL